MKYEACIMDDEEYITHGRIVHSFVITYSGISFYDYDYEYDEENDPTLYLSGEVAKMLRDIHDWEEEDYNLEINVKPEKVIKDLNKLIQKLRNFLKKQKDKDSLEYKEYEYQLYDIKDYKEILSCYKDGFCELFYSEPIIED